MQFYGRRVATYCAALVMAVALVAILAGCGGAGEAPGAGVEPADAREGAGLKPAASSVSPPQNLVDTARGTPFSAPVYAPRRVLSYAEWRASEPVTIATEDEVFVALVEAGIPHREASVLARASVNCESPVRQRDGVSIGARMDARGDAGGRSQGPLQVNTAAHEWARGMYLADLTASAEAAARVYRMQGVGAWSCR